ncbi:hypothetical protein BC940DRAFT_313508 [Gongronella butleri]|nr:hypothetical protein BC940DRAFT_313508 [Gongronella butleri]
MLPQEVDTGLWSNNSSSVSLHDHRPASFLDSLSDLSVKDILDMYKHDAELLKHILLAKAEEDKVMKKKLEEKALFYFFSNTVPLFFDFVL